MFTHMNQKA